MKKIIVPTDFSKNADNALDYAIEYVNRIKGHLTVVHIYDDAGAFTRKEAFKQMADIVRKLQTKLVKGVTFDRVVKRGEPVYILTRMSTQYDLFIMGAQGASALANFFLGSTTSALLQYITKPLLVIPNGLRYQPIKNVVLSLDSQAVKGNTTLLPVKDLLESFKANLLLFHADKNMLDKGIDKTTLDLLGTTEYTIDYTISEENINSLLEEIVKTYAVDVLVMIRRERSWWKRIFHRSTTTKEVLNAPAPLLILQEQVEDDSSVVDTILSAKTIKIT